jgi:hypothetical protein
MLVLADLCEYKKSSYLREGQCLDSQGLPLPAVVIRETSSSARAILNQLKQLVSQATLIQLKYPLFFQASFRLFQISQLSSSNKQTLLNSSCRAKACSATHT